MTKRTAFVTGAATGIGKGLAKKLDREGWTVFAGYNRTPPDALIEACSTRLRALLRCHGARGCRGQAQERAAPSHVPENTIERLMRQMLEHGRLADLQPTL